MLIAHRGKVDSINKENTIEAFKAAINDIKYDGFELDIRETKDKKIVVVHDFVVDNKLIKRVNYKELERYNIPLLESVLKLDTEKIIMIEIKDPNMDIAALSKLLEKYQDLLKEKLGRNNIKREKATWTYNDNKEDGYSYTLTFNYSDLKEFIDIYNNLYSEDLSIDNNSSLTIKLYSKGLLNSFVSYDVDLQVENTSLNITKTHSDKIAIKFTSEDGETNILVSNNNANSYNIEVNFNGDNKIIVSISMEDVSEITKHSITDSVSMSELTEEDYKVISDNILKNEVLNNLVEDISKVFNKD